MKKMFLSALAVAALAFVGCTEDATNDLAQNGGAAVELHEITFEAEIEQPSRTSLADPGTGSSYVCWDANDEIAILTDNGQVYKATVNSGAGKPWATFTANISGNAVAAVYPYQFSHDSKSSVKAVDKSTISLSFPPLQTYKAGSVFGDDENVMVGVAETGANGIKFAMKSVMGAFELKFTGSQKVLGITVKAPKTTQKLSGKATINTNTKDVTMGTTSSTSFSFTTLDVPEAVTLNSSKATSFYVLVPAGTYEKLQIGVMTEDGSYIRTATKAHTVKAGEIKPINCGNLDTMIDESKAVNLSANGCANCYVFAPNGTEQTYVFDTKLVDGTDLTKHVNTYLNGRYITTTYKNHATADEILARTVHIIWAEKLGIAYDIHFDKANGKVYFKNDGKTLGNARLMLTCDPTMAHTLASNIIRPDNHFIWGWQIWATCSEPQVSIAKDSSGNSIGLMDRNLGATWTSTKVSEITSIDATKAAGAVGLYYQFGNMAPQPRQETFIPAGGSWGHASNTIQYGFADYTHAWSSSSAAKSTLEEAIQFPYYRYAAQYTPTKYHSDFKDKFSGEYNWIKMDIMCGDNSSNQGYKDGKPVLWGGQGSKKNYDPCPPGWVVPHRGNIYQAMQGSNAADTHKKVGPQVGGKYVGHYVTYDNESAAFYPWPGYHGSNSVGNTGVGYYWACGYYSQSNDPKTGTSVTYNLTAYGRAAYKDNKVNATTYFDQKELAIGYQVRCVKRN